MHRQAHGHPWHSSGNSLGTSTASRAAAHCGEWRQSSKNGPSLILPITESLAMSQGVILPSWRTKQEAPS